MEYLVVIDGHSAVGGWLLQNHNKIGGSSAMLQQGGQAHPVIIATDLDMATAPGFVQMIHVRNPGAPDPLPRRLVVPAAVMLGAWPAEPPASQQPAQQDKHSSSLH